MSLDLNESYAVCRAIARREARNFYYSFVALPEPKRNAICAVYAFMRHADDLSDDESKLHAERRADLDKWLAAWHEAAHGGETNDPVFFALRDAQDRFHISTELLDQLVQGTTMDLDAPDASIKNPAANSIDTYRTFDDLYRYCYLVASVVGLVCIRIFGYSDARAEKLAEETGIAFQLTNILRDVREDAERGRIYLPLEDMERFGVRPEEVATLRDGHAMNQSHRDLLAFEARRAHHYYEAAQQLLPMIDADSRPALWVLVAIYSRLLVRIERQGYDVFSSKVSVPTSEKLFVLARGITQVLVNRMRGGARPAGAEQ